MRINLEKFFLILLTVFALLFLLSFQAFVSVRSQLRRAEKIVEAYRMYVSEDYENFERYVEKNDLKELKNLKDNLRQRLFERYYILGVTKLNAGIFLRPTKISKGHSNSCLSRMKGVRNWFTSWVRAW